LGTIDFLVGLTRDLYQEIRYTVRFEPGLQTKEETLELASGSCRDSAWLEVQLLRHLGVAARFVSGYLLHVPADDKAADRADLHAWCEAYLPGAGWVGLDPASGLLAAEGHIPLACTPEAESAAPVEGSAGISEVTFEHAIELRRIDEPASGSR